MTKVSRFQRHSAVYTCGLCGIRTRETGECESGSELCADCFTIAGIDNHCNDNGIPLQASEYADEVAGCIKNIAKKGGDIEKVKRHNTFCFPAAPTKESTMKSKTTKTNGATAILATIAKARAKGERGGADLSGSFTISPDARSAGLDALPLRPGSARYQLLADLWDKKSFTREEATAVIGSNAGQVLSGLTLYGILKTA